MDVVTLIVTSFDVKISPMADSETPKNPARARRYRGVDAQARVAERRQKFLEAGLECFGTRGYHDVTVRELCGAAHLTERYFYESFQDREGLFAALYESLISRLRADILGAIAAGPPEPETMARAALGVWFKGLKRDPRVARILLLEVLSVSRDMDRLAQRATLGFGELLQQVAFARTGRRAALDADLVATGLIGATIHIAMRWTLAGFRQPVAEVIDAALGFYQAIVRHYAIGRPQAP
jgi:AcrR family transcriptional regulator